MAATPVVPPEAVTPVVNPALDPGPMPWEGGTPAAAPAADITPLADDAQDAPAVAASDEDGWLTPDTAVRGEFGELVEPPPAPPEPAWDPMADQPLGAAGDDAWFAEPGVPAEPGLPDERTALAGAADIDDPWVTTAQDIGATNRRETPVVPMPAAGASDADWDYTGKAGSYGADAVADAVEASAGHLHDEQAAGAPTPPAGTDGWVDGYDETAAALFGEPEASTDAAQAAAPESYLAAEWPPAATDDAMPHADPSTLPTPVMGSVAVPPVPTADVPPDASLVAAIEEPAPRAHIGRVADDAMESREGVALALERVAARVRSGELPVTGATAVSDAAALAATLAALLGVSSRE